MFILSYPVQFAKKLRSAQNPFPLPSSSEGMERYSRLGQKVKEGENKSSKLSIISCLYESNLSLPLQPKNDLNDVVLTTCDGFLVVSQTDFQGCS